MPNKGRRTELLKDIQQTIEQILQRSPGDLKAAKSVVAYLSWLAWHCRQYADVPSFLDAARSDIVGILYASVLGMERSAYLHARSLLENLVRHCYYDSSPALFTARRLEREDQVQDRWAELFKHIQHLPHFQPTWDTLTASAEATPGSAKDAPRASILFAELQAVYSESSRFVHGSTVRYRSAYEGIGSIVLDDERTQELGSFLQRVGEVSLLLLAMLHLGPYLLISQPIRRYMLEEMRAPARARFLRCMAQVSLPWAQHQRSAALRTLHERKGSPIASRDGILIEEDGLVLVVRPVRGET